MRLESVTIQNIHGFKDEVCIPFSKSKNVIIGENGSGKSTLLNVIERILMSMLHSLSISYYNGKINFEPKVSKLSYKFSELETLNFEDNSSYSKYLEYKKRLKMI